MKPRTLERLVFGGLRDMPDGCVSLGDMGWNRTGSWRYMRPIYVDRTAPCIMGCPTASPIERWIGLMEKGRIEEAFDLIRVESPFPGVMGRVCFHPCEGACNRSRLEGAVSINALERHLGDAAAEIGPAAPHELPAPMWVMNVAVVGSGPSGLAAAFHLARLGHKVTVFERLSSLGGMLRYGIPSYRLPRAVLDTEVARIAAMGVEFRTGAQPIPASLPADGFDKVYLAFGAQRSRPLGVTGDDCAGVRAGLRFLSTAAAGDVGSVPSTVLVVGGGNTAVDCARVARRLGGTNVRILYRRTRAEMPAFEAETEAALAEGVAIDFLVAPSRVYGDGNKVSLSCFRMRLGEPGPDGRRKPVAIEGSEFTITAGLVLSAIGEEAELELAPDIEARWGSLVVDDAMRTGTDGFYAGGDMTDNPRTVVDAIAMGKRAAIAMDCAARGIAFDDCLKRIALPGSRALSMENYLRVVRLGIDNVATVPEAARFDLTNPAWFERARRGRRPEVPVAGRMGGATGRFVEVHPDLDRGEALAEAGRCMHCGRCIECDNCFLFCPDAAITPVDTGGYVIDYNYCKGCGLCVRECPRAAMNMIGEKTGGA